MLSVPIFTQIRSLVEQDFTKVSSNEDALPDSFIDESNGEWTFSTFIGAMSEDNPAFFEPLMLNHRLLMMQYHALRDEISDELSKKDRNEPLLIKQVQAALAVAELLECIQQPDAMDTWQALSPLRNDQQSYRQWLEARQFKFSDAPDLTRGISTGDYWFQTKPIREHYDWVNFIRLSVVRMRRAFLLLAVVLNDPNNYGFWLSSIEQYTGPFFAYVAWVFFSPRLVTNLAIMGRHVFFPGDKEAGSWWDRLQVQLSRRGNEVANDVAWLVNGIMTCFILVGPLLPAAIYLAVMMQCYDFMMAGVRAMHEIACLRDLEMDYLDMRAAAVKRGDRAEWKEIDRYLVHLRQRMVQNEKLLYLGVFNFGVLCFAMALSLPFIAAISPIIPLVGAFMAIAVTFYNFYQREALRGSIPPNQLNAKLAADKRPKNNEMDKPASLLQGKHHRMFKVAPDANKEHGAFSSKKKLQSRSTTALGQSSTTVFGI